MINFYVFNIFILLFYIFFSFKKGFINDFFSFIYLYILIKYFIFYKDKFLFIKYKEIIIILYFVFLSFFEKLLFIFLKNIIFLIYFFINKILGLMFGIIKSLIFIYILNLVYNYMF